MGLGARSPLSNQPRFPKMGLNRTSINTLLLSPKFAPNRPHRNPQTITVTLLSSPCLYSRRALFCTWHQKLSASYTLILTFNLTLALSSVHSNLLQIFGFPPRNGYPGCMKHLRLRTRPVPSSRPGIIGWSAESGLNIFIRTLIA